MSDRASEKTATAVRNGGDAPASANTAGGRPLFFRQLEVLEASRHGDLRLRRTGGFEFARDSHMVPLNVVEFMAAARHYPILFNGDAGGMPVILVGVRAAQNLFVEADGRWTDGCYIPAFVRRYPFILLRDGRNVKADGSVPVRLGIDVDAAAVLRGEGEGDALFDADQPTELMKRMGRFCGAFAREQARTRRFVEACKAEDLLVDRAVDIELSDGRHMAIRGFRVVDEEKLRALPAERMEQWWRSGWFALAVAHLVSLGNFGRLFKKDEGRSEAPMDFGAR